jgi:hypothetical protein
MYFKWTSWSTGSQLEIGELLPYQDKSLDVLLHMDSCWLYPVPNNDGRPVSNLVNSKGTLLKSPPFFFADNVQSVNVTVLIKLPLLGSSE